MNIFGIFVKKNKFRLLNLAVAIYMIVSMFFNGASETLFKF